MEILMLHEYGEGFSQGCLLVYTKAGLGGDAQ
jgi:hypothetical protein